MLSEPKNIPLKGLFPLPKGLDTAPVDIRGRFWKWLGSVALRLKRDEISEGIDRFGNKFLPVRRKWGEPTPLLPHGLASRTYRLLTYNWSAQAATLYWKSGGGRESWPTILGYHAYKHGPRSLPVRNPIGLSPRSVRALEEQAQAIWREIGPSPPPPTPKPKPRPKPRGPKPKPIPLPEPPPPPPIRLPAAEDRRQMAEADRLTHEAMAEARTIMDELRKTTRPAPTKAEVEEELGVKFKPSAGAKSMRYKTVVIDVSKVDADLRLDPDQYVGAGGTGTIAGRIERFGQFLDKAREKRIPVEMPRMQIRDATNLITISDGRHRFAVFRDEGATHLPVSVPAREAAEIKRRYGGR
jgi:hypothetical protein